MYHMQKKKKRARRRGEDLISELPDEILVSILSRLTLREAAGTSVLSRRWRHLWTYTSRLNFDSKVNKIVRRSHPLTLSTPKRRRKYINKYIKWVHKVLRNYRGGPNLDEFRVSFDLSKTSHADMDKWFEFAMSKNVKNLEFDFSRCSFKNQDSHLKLDLLSYFRNRDRDPIRSYNFPHLMLGLREDPPMNMNPNGMFVGFKSLKTLSLKSINVSSEAIEYFLSNSPLLERLCVHRSSSLVSLRVAGPSIMLRHLEIVGCSSIQTIEICDTNLVSFTYWGDGGDGLPNNMLIKNVPLLVQVSVGVGKLGFVKNMLSSCAHQLQILQLTVYHFMLERLSAYLLPKLRNLKQLELIVFGGCPEDCLLGFVAMLNKCPHLESLVLQLKMRNKMIRVANRYAMATIQYSHRYLKVVKVVGFDDCSSHCELIMQIIENSIALEKIIIDTSQGHRRRGKWLNRRLAARTRAEQLKLHVPPSLEFIVV